MQRIGLSSQEAKCQVPSWALSAFLLILGKESLFEARTPAYLSKT